MMQYTYAAIEDFKIKAPEEKHIALPG